jgi:hypothetical protein
MAVESSMLSSAAGLDRQDEQGGDDFESGCLKASDAAYKSHGGQMEGS